MKDFDRYMRRRSAAEGVANAVGAVLGGIAGLALVVSIASLIWGAVAAGVVWALCAFDVMQPPGLGFWQYIGIGLLCGLVLGFVRGGGK